MAIGSNSHGHDQKKWSLVVKTTFESSKYLDASMVEVRENKWNKIAKQKAKENFGWRNQTQNYKTWPCHIAAIYSTSPDLQTASSNAQENKNVRRIAFHKTRLLEDKTWRNHQTLNYESRECNSCHIVAVSHHHLNHKWNQATQKIETTNGINIFVVKIVQFINSLGVKLYLLWR